MNRFVEWLEHFQGPREAEINYTPEEEVWWRHTRPAFVRRAGWRAVAALLAGALVGWLVTLAADPSSALAFTFSGWEFAILVIMGVGASVIASGELAIRKEQMVRSRRLREAMHADETETVVNG